MIEGSANELCEAEFVKRSSLRMDIAQMIRIQRELAAKWANRNASAVAPGEPGPARYRLPRRRVDRIEKALYTEARGAR